jgi:hypothetical protein
MLNHCIIIYSICSFVNSQKRTIPKIFFYPSRYNSPSLKNCDMWLISYQHPFVIELLSKKETSNAFLGPFCPFSCSTLTYWFDFGSSAIEQYTTQGLPLGWEPLIFSNQRFMLIMIEDQINKYKRGIN